MKIENDRLKIGSVVKLKEDVKLFNVTYTKGHIFTIYGESYRGFDLIDKDGNKMTECLFIHDKLQIIKS